MSHVSTRSRFWVVTAALTLGATPLSSSVFAQDGGKIVNMGNAPEPPGQTTGSADKGGQQKNDDGAKNDGEKPNPPKDNKYDVFVQNEAKKLTEWAKAVTTACQQQHPSTVENVRHIITTLMKEDAARNPKKTAAKSGLVKTELNDRVRASLGLDKDPVKAAVPDMKGLWASLQDGILRNQDLAKVGSAYFQGLRPYVTAAQAQRKAHCSRYTGANPTVLSLSSFADDALATAAVLSDHPSVVLIEKDLAKLARAAQADGEVVWGTNDPLVGLVPKAESGIGPTVSIEAFGAQLAVLGLEGLAKLIVERAKYETVAWMLDRVGKDLCFPGIDDSSNRIKAKHDMSEYWMPKLCKRAGQDSLWQYGTSTATLDAIRSDIAVDVKGWPGAIVGLALGEGFRADASEFCKEHQTICAGTCAVATPNDAFCKESQNNSWPLTNLGKNQKEIRKSTGRRLTAILQGRNAALALRELGEEVQRSNKVKVSGTWHFYSPATAVTACIATLPHTVAGYAKLELNLSESEKARAVTLAGLTTPRACLDLVGRGRRLEACLEGPDPSACQEEDSLQDPIHVERLSTLARLDSSVGKSLRNLAKRAQELQASIQRAEAAATPAREAIKAWKDVKPPMLDASALGKGESAGDVIRNYVNGISDAYQLAAVREYLTNTLDVADTSVALSDETLEALLTLTKLEDIVPGLCHGAVGVRCGDLAEAQKPIEDAKAALVKVGDTVRMLRAIVSGNWSQTVSDGLGALADYSSQTGIDEKAAKQLARTGAVLAAILQARNGDEMAVALDAAASPPGGWRLKQNTTASLTVSAFPGLSFAFETRSGTYLAKDGPESFGDHTYKELAVLTLPVGLDVAWTPRQYANLGLFIPLLDPAGFISYDTEDGGRVPGASLKTAICLGLGIRYAIPTTPFNVMLLGTYRPGFRQEEPDAMGVGADAFQLGFLLGVDVTLLQLTSTRDEINKK